VDIRVTDEFREWFESLTEAAQEDVGHVVGVLSLKGLTLGDPLSRKIRGTKLIGRTTPGVLLLRPKTQRRAPTRREQGGAE
jgi:hypothetical protein